MCKGSFLILHEVTAFVPLFALFGLFQSSETLSVGKPIVEYCKSSEGRLGRWVIRSEEYIARVGKRKGWFGYEKAGEEVTGKELQKTEELSDRAVETTANAVAAYLFIKVSLFARTNIMPFTRHFD